MLVCLEKSLLRIYSFLNLITWTGDQDISVQVSLLRNSSNKKLHKVNFFKDLDLF